MVAVIPVSPAAIVPARQRSTGNPSLASEGPSQPGRPPVNSSEIDNASASRRPRIKEVTSRYLSSYAASSSSSTTGSSSSSGSTANSATTAGIYSSSSSSSRTRRFPSPLVPHRSNARASPLPHSTCPKRSQSVDRTRPVTPRLDPGRYSNTTAPEISSATKTLCTTTRSLSVSFQGESFFYQTRKARVANSSPTRRSTPERRRLATTPVRSSGTESKINGVVDQRSENPRPGDHHRWPAARTKQCHSLTRSLDYSMDKKGSMSATIKLLQNAVILDEGRRSSFDGGDLSASSDTDTVSSGSNSHAHEPFLPSRRCIIPRGISMPARFNQETSNKLQRIPEPGIPSSTPLPKVASTPRLAFYKQKLVDSPVFSPRVVSSPLRGPVRASSPGKIVSIPSRTVSSPLKTSTGTLGISVVTGQPGNLPSMINFASEFRRGKKGETRIEDAHTLRLLHNRYLQWRYVNAKERSSMLAQRLTVEKTMYDAWVTTAAMRDRITVRRIKLHMLKQNMKLSFILNWQIPYLEEWSQVESEDSGSLLGATEALKASTLRLPVTAGAQVNIQNVKDALGYVVDVMQSMGSSICSLLPKVEEMSSIVAELAKIVAKEQALLDQCRDLLCTVAATHVNQCSVEGHLLQLKPKATWVKLRT